MSDKGRRGIADNEVVLVALLVGAVGIVLAFAWWAASPAVGLVYKWTRTIQTLGLWPFLSEWGRYFFSVPSGSPYLFRSIFQSSVPFNVLNAFSIGVIAWLAYRKVSSKHIAAHIRSENPRDWREIMEKQSAEFPANGFFLRYPLADYPLSHGPARLPPTALDLLESANAILGIYDDESPRSGWKIDEEKVTEKLISCFGPINPFAQKDFRFSEREAVATAIASIPWQHIVIMSACIERIYAQGLYSEEDFGKALIAADRKMKDIWRQFNHDKDKMGIKLTLGFIDEDDKAIKIASAHEKEPGCKVYSFAEYLDEIVDEDGKSVPRVETYAFVKSARSRMVSIMTEYLDVDPDRPTNVEGKRGSFKRLSDLTEREKAEFKVFENKRYEVVRGKISQVLTRHGYLFGVVAALLTETRRGGIFPPALFRWMRFYDFDLWSFLRCHGMNTPTPNIAGMFDHFQVEEKNGQPVARPYLTSAVEAVRIEASKYLTDELRARYQIIRSRRKAQEKSVEAARLIANALREHIDRRQPQSLMPAKADPDESAVGF